MTDRIDAERLRRFASACLSVQGMPVADADLVADSLVQADLWGHQSHGVMRLPWYGARIANRVTRAKAEVAIAMDAGALVLLDGGDAMGQVVTDRAMTLAIERARRHGIGAVSVRNSGHFGTAMYFTRHAALSGFIGVLTTNSSPAMPPTGGREKRLGANPWSIASPAGSHPPMMLDISNTAVARGKLYMARQRGEPIPQGWAVDAEGAPTTDPVAGIAGAIMPMGGHKGYGISMMMDVLSGVLSGSGFGADISGPFVPDQRSRAGHLAIVIDIAKCRPLDAFEADVERMIRDIKETPRAAGVDEIFYPGEPEARSDARCRAHGLSIPEPTLASLREHGAELGIAADF